MEEKQILDVLRAHSVATPDRIAFTFLSDKLEAVSSISYGDLWKQTNDIAKAVAGRFSKGSRVVLPASSDLTFLKCFLGCLLSQIVPVPVAPLSLRKFSSLVERIAASSSPSGILTDLSYLSDAKILSNIPVVSLRDLEQVTQKHDFGSPNNESLAFLQYTSGSISDPKGVRISHGNLIANMKMISANFGHNSETKFATWLPFYHDMGLVGTLLQPLFCGTTCFVISPSTFLKNPQSWLELISKFGIHTSGGPDFAYDLCSNSISIENLSIDLSCWKVAFNGAEPVRAKTILEFEKKFGRVGFSKTAMFPCYGMAEATLFVSGGPKHTGARYAVEDGSRIRRLSDHASLVQAINSSKKILVSCGKIADQLSVQIVDKNRAVLGRGEVGQIHLNGESISSGYQGEVSQQLKENTHTGKNSLRLGFPTGDIGCVDEGELFVSGRIKDLIIVRGRNLYPQDIEDVAYSAASEDLVRNRVACFQKPDLKIVIVAECLKKTLSLNQTAFDKLKKVVRREVLEKFDIVIDQVCLVRPASIPVTTSGKISRSKCIEILEREQFRDISDYEGDSSNFTSKSERGSTDNTSRAILEIIASITSVPLSELIFPLSNQSVDSMKCFAIIGRMEAELELTIPSALLIEAKSIDELVLSTLRLVSDDNVSSINSALTATQLSIWTTSQREKNYANSSIIFSGYVRGDKIEVDLKIAIEKLINHHEVLSYQVVEEQGTFFFKERDLPQVNLFKGVVDVDSSIEAFINDIQWKLYKPLFQSALFVTQSSETVLVLVCHHVIADLASFATILQDIGDLMLKRELKIAKETSSSFIRSTEKSLDFWRSLLSDLSFSADVPRDVYSDIVPISEAQVHFDLDSEHTGRIIEASKLLGCPPYIVYLVAYVIVLHCILGNETQLISSPFTDRRRPSDLRSIGCKIDMTLLPINVSSNMTLRELSTSVTNLIVSVWDHSWVGLPFIAQEVSSLNLASFKNIPMFSYQSLAESFGQPLSNLALGRPKQQFKIGGLDMLTTRHCIRHPQAALDLAIVFSEGKLSGYLGSNGHFGEKFLSNFLYYIDKVISKIIQSPESKLDEISLFSRKDQLDLINTDVPKVENFPLLRIEQIFDEQCKQTPSAIALSTAERQTTYEELRLQSIRIAKLIENRLKLNNS